MTLKDKVAVITGGTSGIGLAIAELFAANGANVVIASDAPSEDVIASISPRLTFLQTDVRDEDQVRSLITKTVEKYHRLDILVNSAGVYSFLQNDISSMPLSDVDRTMDINFKGIFLTTKYAIPELLKTRGNIINIASSLGIVPEKESAIYCASKAAVIMFSKAVALQFPEKGLRVNCICPGPIDTPMLHRAFPEQKEYDEYLKMNPMQRAGRPDEVAKLALFLASDDASYVTGAAYTIDGGESLR